MHVNSSLPRSGSELLQALIAQHPDIYASATSPLLEYMYGAMSNLTLPEVLSQPEGAMKSAFAGFCREGAKGYYQALTGKGVVVDKSRGWLEYAEVLWAAFPDARIVSMVRDPEEIVKSLERIYQANPGHPNTRDLPKTAAARRDAWIAPGSTPLGLALERLYNRQSKGVDSRILYVRFADLCNSPVATMLKVFDHLNVSAFEISPNKVLKAAEEDDRHFGIFGEHTVHPAVLNPSNCAIQSTGVTE